MAKKQIINFVNGWVSNIMVRCDALEGALCKGLLMPMCIPLMTDSGSQKVRFRGARGAAPDALGWCALGRPCGPEAGSPGRFHRLI